MDKHYPDSCTKCGSPAYIGAGFTPPECSNASCEHFKVDKRLETGTAIMEKHVYSQNGCDELKFVDKGEIFIPPPAPPEWTTPSWLTKRTWEKLCEMPDLLPVERPCLACGEYHDSVVVHGPSGLKIKSCHTVDDSVMLVRYDRADVADEIVMSPKRMDDLEGQIPKIPTPSMWNFLK